MSDAVGTTNLSFPRIFTRANFFLLTGVVLISVGLWLNNGVAGPPGPRGEQGPPGPPGPGSEISTAEFAKLSAVVAAIAKVQFLERQLSSFNAMVDRYNSMYDNQVNMLKARDKGVPLGFGAHRQNMADPSDEIEGTVKRDLGIEVSLKKHPNFDLNQNNPVPGDADFSDPAIKTDFRRIWDEKNTADNVILNIRSKYNELISTNTSVILQYGR